MRWRFILKIIGVLIFFFGLTMVFSSPDRAVLSRYQFDPAGEIHGNDRCGRLNPLSSIP